MKPEQEQMAKEMPQDAGGALKNYHTTANELMFAVKDYYPGLAFSFQKASQWPTQLLKPTFDVARARDLRILHEIFKRLNKLPNNEGVSFIFVQNLTHMNTPEGAISLQKMAEAHFQCGPVIDALTKYRAKFEARNNESIKYWNKLFSPPPIEPAEYMDGKALPTNTEYPPMPEGTELD